MLQLSRPYLWLFKTYPSGAGPYRQSGTGPIGRHFYSRQIQRLFDPDSLCQRCQHYGSSQFRCLGRHWGTLHRYGYGPPLPPPLRPIPDRTWRFKTNLDREVSVAKDWLRRYVQKAYDAGCEEALPVVRMGDPSTNICELADELEADFDYCWPQRPIRAGRVGTGKR